MKAKLMSVILMVLFALVGSVAVEAAVDPKALQVQEAVVTARAKWNLIKIAIERLEAKDYADANTAKASYETVLAGVKEFVPVALSRYVLEREGKFLGAEVAGQIEAVRTSFANIDYGLKPGEDCSRITALVIDRALKAKEAMDQMFARLPQPQVKLDAKRVRQVLDDELYAVFDYLHVQYRTVANPLPLDKPTAARVAILNSLALETADQMFEYVVSNKAIVTPATTPIIGEIDDMLDRTVRVTRSFAKEQGDNWEWAPFQKRLADRYIEIKVKIGDLRLLVMGM